MLVLQLEDALFPNSVCVLGDRALIVRPPARVRAHVPPERARVAAAGDRALVRPLARPPAPANPASAVSLRKSPDRRFWGGRSLSRA